jgi:hypothetical protein
VERILMAGEKGQKNGIENERQKQSADRSEET